MATVPVEGGGVDMSSMTAGDELLRWVSEAGSGSWTQLRDACAYVTQKHQLTLRPWLMASDLSRLGHIDIDWASQRWSVAPPTLNLVRGLGQCIVLTGSRPWYVDEWFNEATDSLSVYPFEIEQHPGPRARFAKCASVDDAAAIASAMEAQFVIDPAAQLAAALVPVDREPLTQASPPLLDDAQLFDPASLDWIPAPDAPRPGLYRIDLHGRSQHRRLDELGLWWSIDLAAGQFLELVGRENPVVTWRPATAAQPSQLLVSDRLALPLLAERAAVMCSGLLPQRSDGWRSYRNVPEDLAGQLMAALLQPGPTNA